VNARRQSVEVVVPVFDEQATVEENVGVLLGSLRDEFPFSFSIVVADDASADATPRLAATLAARHPEVSVLRLERKGRGRALRSAWPASAADTELLLLAERNGYRIHEVPVDWIEDLDSRVDLPSTIAGDLRGLWRLRRAFWRGRCRLGVLGLAEAAP
jgi:glycosyltransferase involved in cell wall biosynthesis